MCVYAIVDVKFHHYTMRHRQAADIQAAASNYEAMLNELKLQPWHKNSTRSNVVSLENDKGLLIERLPIEVDVSVYYDQQRREALEAAQ